MSSTTPPTTTPSSPSKQQQQQHPSQSKSASTPALPIYHTSTWKLLSQGAEARIWFIPSFLSSTTSSFPAICKERFSKKYRHPDLDTSILKSRTKAEVKCLVRCRRGGVNCPVVYGVDSFPKKKVDQDDTNGGRNNNMCLFLEYVEGITVREYFENRRSNKGNDVENENEDFGEGDDDDKTKEEGSSSPPRKKSKLKPDNDTDSDNDTTEIDVQALRVASSIGHLIAKMHNVNIIHGDLTTSNILLRNPPSSTDSSSSSSSWSPRLILIDFGLGGTAGAKGVTHEEKAVDLYVLERAFMSTHPKSRYLVREIMTAYKEGCMMSDAVLQRLSTVRLRGRKRECFG